MKTKKLIFLIFFGIFCLYSFLLFAQTNLIERNEKINDYTEIIDYQNNLITVASLGRPSPYFTGSMAQQLIFAMTEARKKAYTRMAIYLESLRVDGETTIANTRIMDNEFRIRLDELVKNAREIENKQLPQKDRSMMYRSTVGIFMTGKNSLNSILIPQLKQKYSQSPSKQFNIPKNYKPVTAPKKFEPDTKYTGLIIDARKLALYPAMAPRILAADGREIYGTMKISTEYAIEMGIVGYTKNIKTGDVRNRVGKNPLIIKAQRVIGVNKTDAIVSEGDAGRILWADQIGDFLPECRVIFWVK